MTDESFIYIKDNQNHKVNEINFLIVKDERNKEYLVSSIWDFSYNYYFFEIYDLEHNRLYQYNFDIVLSIFNMVGFTSIFEIKENNNYYTIISGLFYGIDGIHNFTLNKIKIEKDEYTAIELLAYRQDIQVDRNFKDSCCYNIDKEKIICFIYYNSALIRYIFNYEFEFEKEELSIHNFQTNLLKCIHIKSNIGSFIYLNAEDNDMLFLNIEFINYKGSDGFENYLPTLKYKINYNDLDYKTNNFLKISDNKICFITVDDDLLRIYLIYLYEQEIDNSKKVIMREYNIFTADLYNFYISRQISSIIYNNFIALSFNMNYATIFEEYYGGLMIFGYANSTDYNLD